MILNLYIFLKFSDTSEINNFAVHFWESEKYMQNSRSSEWNCVDFREKVGVFDSTLPLISQPKTFCVKHKLKCVEHTLNPQNCENEYEI